MKRYLVILLLACLALPVFAGAQKETAAAGNDAWVPTKPISLVVPYAAGGGTDLLARTIEKIWPKYSPQPIQVVSKPGGGGVTGSVFVATSAPDGYTMCMGYGSGCDMSMPILQKLEYDPFKAMDPLVLINVHPVMVGVLSTSEFKTLADIADWSKKNNKPVTFASSTANGTVDLVLQAFAKKTGFNATILQTDGTAQSVSLLLGNQVMACGAHPTDIFSHVKSGAVRGIGIAAEQRDSSQPDVPTFKEQGIDFAADGSIKGIGVPKNMPDNIKKYYEATFKKVCDDPEFIRIVTKELGQPVTYMNTADFTAYFRKAADGYKVLIEGLGLAYYQQKK